MTPPLWLAVGFAVLIAATAAYCLLRLVVSWRQQRPTDYLLDAVHVLMGVAMTGMLLPQLRVLPAVGWEAVFGVATAVFGWRLLASRARRPAHQVQHLLGCAAMLYMLPAAASQRIASTSPGLDTMTSAARFPTLALILACCVLGYVVWTADRIPSLSRVAAVAAMSPAPLAAGLTAGSAPAAPKVTASGSDRARRGVPLSPRLAACCEIAMGLTMGYMLVMMLS
jgi:hypothetical protein